MNIVNMSAIMVAWTTEPEILIERMGRLCYQSEPGNEPDNFIRMLLKRGHESVLEHAMASFILTTDRGITHEIVRHRLASFSQESTRFCCYTKEKFGGEISVVEPPFINSSSIWVWSEAMLCAEEFYKQLIALGEKPEIARSVLPTCLKASIGITANFREWRHIIQMRFSKAAHPQIRILVKDILDKLISLAPSCFYDLCDLK